jgi:hypothetical protein
MLRDELLEAQARIAALEREQAVADAYYDVAVTERDLARCERDALRASVDVLEQALLDKEQALMERQYVIDLLCSEARQ